MKVMIGTVADQAELHYSLKKAALADAGPKQTMEEQQRPKDDDAEP